MQPDTNRDPERFSIFIIEAGVSGLLFANIVKRLSVKHLVLEARENFEEKVRSSYATWPSAARTFEQIGCWDAVPPVPKACDPPKSRHVRQPNSTACRIPSDIVTLNLALLCLDCVNMIDPCMLCRPLPCLLQDYSQYAVRDPLAQDDCSLSSIDKSYSQRH